MRKIFFAFCSGLFLCALCHADTGQQENQDRSSTKEDVADSQENQRTRSTNPRWFRNPQARSAHLRGESAKEVRKFPIRGDRPSDDDERDQRNQDRNQDRNQARSTSRSR